MNKTFTMFQQAKGELTPIGEIQAVDGKEALKKAARDPRYLKRRGLARWPIVEEKQKSDAAMIEELRKLLEKETIH